MFDLNGKKVLVIGLARTGVATSLFCARHEAIVTAVDTRPESELAEIAAKLRDAKNFEEAIFKKDGLRADLHGAFLTDKQRDFCQKEGVIIDEAPTTSSSQSNNPTFPPSENTDSNSLSPSKPDKES